MKTTHRARPPRATGPRTAAPVLLLLVAACDGIIDVEAPSRVPADELASPANAALLVRSAATDFECALAQYTVAGGLVGNELESSGTQVGMKEYDRRDFNPIGSLYTSVTCDATSVVGVYIPLSIARWQADNALRLLEGWTSAEVADRDRLLATAATYAGYAYVLLGEGMCSAAIDVGPEQSPTQLFATAETRFTAALAAAEAVADADLTQRALLGRARARHRLGELAAAAEDARRIADGFRWDATYASAVPRRRNAIAYLNRQFPVISVGAPYRDVAFEGVADPRVSVSSGGTGEDGSTPLWLADKYGDVAEPVAIGRWAEARLIIAEAEGGAVAVDVINELHARAGLPAYAGGSPAEVAAHVVEERSRELFLESHHLGDLRQYELPLVPAPGTPFKDGGTYQGQRCFELPDRERANNPNA